MLLRFLGDRRVGLAPGFRDWTSDLGSSVRSQVWQDGNAVTRGNEKGKKKFVSRRFG